MKKRILLLGAGFGGLELATRLSEALGDTVETTLVDQSDHFVLGFEKLEVMFGRAEPAAVRLPYRAIAKPGLRVLQRTITAIDPATRRITTDGGVLEADYLVIALGADYDVAATPGLAESGYEFYSVAGAERVRGVLPAFKGGRVIVGSCGAPYKCPPAPAEAALLLHDYLERRGIRKQSEITLVIPFATPLPPSPETSAALMAAFAERGIAYVPRAVRELAAGRHAVVLDDGSELPCDLFLAIPKHVAPPVVVASGLTENGWIPVTPRTLETRYPGVYAIGDVSNTGVPKAGVLAEDAARAVAAALIAAVRGGGAPQPYAGAGSCYVEFGAGRVGKMDVDFLTGPKVAATYHAASTALRAEKERFGSSRRARWFGV